MNKNIVLLSGSPRRDGNTDKLAAAFIDGAKSAGKNVTLFRVANMKIGGCLGCNHCFEEKGVCAQKDDMPQILDALLKADTLVLASPVYYFSISAQLKLALDRTYALLGVGTPIKRVALLMTCGNSSTQAADAAIMMYNKMRDLSKWDNAGVIVAPGLHEKDEIAGRDELQQAWKLGVEI